MVKIEAKLFEDDSITQAMYDSAIKNMNQVSDLDPLLIAYQMQLIAKFGCPLYKIYVSLAHLGHTPTCRYRQSFGGWC